MSDQFRKKVIRLAHANPDLRSHLLPLLVKTSALQFKEMRSPLSYQRASNVQRIELCDTSIEEPHHKQDLYFAPTVERDYYSERGRRLKKPKIKPIPGVVGGPCVVGFLDFHKYGETGWYIDYVKTRQDGRGKGYAKALLDRFYKDHSKATLIHWGKLMQPAMGHLLEVMKKKYPKINSIGAKNY